MSRGLESPVATVVVVGADPHRVGWLDDLHPSYVVEACSFADLGPATLARPEVGCVLIDTGATPPHSIAALIAACAVPDHLPVLVLRDDEDEAGALAAVRSGAADVVPKRRLVTGERLRQTVRFAVERHLARAPQRESERRFRNAFDQAPIGMAVIAMDGRLTQVNDSLCRLLEESMEVIVGRDIREFLPALAWPPVAGRPQKLAYPSKSGGHRRVLARVSRVADALGRPAQVVLHVEDVTELWAARWELEDALEDNQRKLRHEVALAECSAALLAGDTPGQLQKALAAVLAAVETSGAFVEINRDDPELGLCSTLTEVVGVPGAVIDRRRSDHVPWAMMPTAHGTLSRGIECRFHAADRSTDERALYEGTHAQSQVVVPIFIGARWVGLVGFVDHAERRDWAEDEVRLLRTTGEMIGAYWDRSDASHRLQVALETARRRARYDRALSMCSQVLLGSNDAEGLRSALAALLEATQATYGFIEVNEDHPQLGPCSRTIIEAELGGAVAAAGHDDYWALVPWSRMPDSHARLSAGKAFAFAVDDLGPVEGQLYREDPHPIMSELNIPIFQHGQWIGLVGFADTERIIEWTDEDIQMLGRAAEMIAAYWERDAALTELEELLRSKDEFLASVSHELRTPLTAALGMAHELRDRVEEFDRDEIGAVSAIIAAQTGEVSNLVEDLLVAARKDLSTLPCLFVPVDLARAITDVLAGLGADMAASVDEVTQDAWADPLRVRQIIRNLVTNALRYGGTHRRVTVRSVGDGVVVAVADDGPEIPAEEQQTMWQPYERARQASTQPSSVGLGLTVSRRLARRMGGDLEYRRDDDCNVFQLRLQAAPAISKAS